MSIESTVEQISPVGHTVSTISVVAAISGVLPTALAIIASTLGVIWYGVAIYESRTFQHWKRSRQMVRKAKKVAKLRAKEKVIIAQIKALELTRSARIEAREMVALAQAEASELVVRESTEAAINTPPI